MNSMQSQKLLIEIFASWWWKEWKEKQPEEKQRRIEPEFERYPSWPQKEVVEPNNLPVGRSKKFDKTRSRSRRAVKKNWRNKKKQEKVAVQTMRNLRQWWSETVNKTILNRKFLLETLGLLPLFLNLISQFQRVSSNHENFLDLEYKCCRWNAFRLSLSREG